MWLMAGSEGIAVRLVFRLFATAIEMDMEMWLPVAIFLIIDTVDSDPLLLESLLHSFAGKHGKIH